MRIDVVFPAPLLPRMPKIAPRGTSNESPDHGGEVAEPLRHVLEAHDGGFGAHAAAMLRG